MAIITDHWIYDITIFISILISLAYLYLTRNFGYWSKLGVTEIPPIPLLGNFKQVLLLKKPPGICFREWYKEYTSLPYLGIYILDKPYLLIRDPDLVQNILVKDFHCFENRHLTPNKKDNLTRANLFFMQNPEWKYVRSKLTPVYTTGKLKMMFELMKEICGDLENNLRESISEADDNGSVLEMKDLSARFTIDIIASTAYGIKANCLNNPNAEFKINGRQIFEYSTYRGYEFLAMFFAPQLVELLNIQFFHRDSTEFLKKIFWDTLIERQASGIKRPDLIDVLIELRRSQKVEEKNIFDLDGDNLVAQAAIFFTGGFETSSTIISFCLYELAVHPAIQSRLRDEIRGALDKFGFTYDAVMSRMPYLDMVIAETLRRYPTLPFLDRVAKMDYKIPRHNLTLKKGLPVIIPLWGFHFDENYFSNPEEFNPENFSVENKKTRRSAVYMPFGYGPHNCIGKRLGYMQMKLGLITILSKYEVSPAKETTIPVRIHPKAVFTTPDGVYLKTKLIN